MTSLRWNAYIVVSGLCARILAAQVLMEAISLVSDDEIVILVPDRLLFRQDVVTTVISLRWR